MLCVSPPMNAIPRAILVEPACQGSLMRLAVQAMSLFIPAVSMLVPEVCRFLATVHSLQTYSKRFKQLAPCVKSANLV
jgi:hypothetical protein